MCKVVKLVSGEEWIANVEEFADHYTLTKILKVILVPTAQGIGMGLEKPSEIIKQDSFDIKKSHVMYIADPIDEVKEGYCKQTNSIITPSLVI